MIKKLKHISIVVLAVAIPASLYMIVYAANVNQYKVESATQSAPIAPLVATDTTKPVVLAVATPKTIAKTTTTKKSTTKKKTKKKARKRKEKLTVTPPLFTPETAPHTGR